MTKQETNNADGAGKMIRTLCILFFTILLSDYCTGNIEWYWIILMAVIILCFSIVNAFVVLQHNKARKHREFFQEDNSFTGA